VLGLQFQVVSLSRPRSDLEAAIIEPCVENPSKHTILLAKLACFDLLETLEHLGYRSNGKTHFLWGKKNLLPFHLPWRRR